MDKKEGYTLVKDEVLEELAESHKKNTLLGFGYAAASDKNSRLVYRANSKFSIGFDHLFKTDTDNGNVYHVNEAGEFITNENGQRLTVQSYFEANPEMIDELS